MKFLQIAYLLLAVLSHVVRGEKLEHNCKTLKHKYMKRVCTGFYPAELATKYPNERIPSGESYAIYTINEDHNRLFFSFHRSELLTCRNFSVANTYGYQCHDPGTVYITFRQVTLHCMNFHMQISDELLQICMQRDRQVVPSKLYNSYTAMHYVGKHFDDEFQYLNEKYATRSSCSVSLTLAVLLLLLPLWLTVRHPPPYCGVEVV